jgi:hypothetical protein
MNKKSLFLIPLFLLTITLSGCESYIAFEKMRTKWLIYAFFGSLIIGLIGLVFSDKK